MSFYHAVIVQSYVMETLASIGFIRLKATCLMFGHKDRVIYRVAHGDEFVVTAEPDDTAWREHQLSEAFERKIEGRASPPELGESSRAVHEKNYCMDQHGLPLERRFGARAEKY